MLTSEQQPLRLNPAEVREVIAAVCSETSSPNTNVMTVTTRLSNNSGNPSMDVAVSVLIKLVIDMYVSVHLSIIFCFLLDYTAVTLPMFSSQHSHTSTLDYTFLIFQLKN